MQQNEQITEKVISNVLHVLLKGHWKYIFKIDFYLILFSLFPKKVLFLQKGSPGMR
jgi:hypothetical protein